MPFIRVPEVGIRGMAELATWSDDRFAEFMRKIDDSPIEVPTQQVLTDAAGEASSASTDAVTAVVSMVRSVIITRNSFPRDDGDYVNELLINAASQSGGTNYGLSDDQITVLRARLPRILESRHLVIGFKATRLLFDRQNIAMDFMVITDVRPVFSSARTPSLESVLIIHSLKIDYECDGGSKEFFLALDETDLKKLVDVAKRALEKDKALKEKMSSCDIQAISVRVDQ